MSPPGRIPSYGSALRPPATAPAAFGAKLSKEGRPRRWQRASSGAPGPTRAKSTRPALQGPASLATGSATPGYRMSCRPERSGHRPWRHRFADDGGLGPVFGPHRRGQP